MATQAYIAAGEKDSYMSLINIFSYNNFELFEHLFNSATYPCWERERERKRNKQRCTCVLLCHPICILPCTSQFEMTEDQLARLSNQSPQPRKPTLTISWSAVDQVAEEARKLGFPMYARVHCLFSWIVPSRYYRCKLPYDKQGKQINQKLKREPSLAPQCGPTETLNTSAHSSTDSKFGIDQR